MVRWMDTPTNHVIARGAWHFGDFGNIFRPNVGEDQKKSYYLIAGPLAYVVNPTLVIALRS